MRSRLLQEVILKSWWALLFVLTLFFVFDRASFERKQELKTLQAKHQALVTQRNEAHLLQRQLERALASREDPRYIELTLMRQLGLVPEGQTKVLFQH